MAKENMVRMERNINPETVCTMSLNQFNALPKTGKPKENEWTVLSCILKEQESNLEVVSLGTGSKCIGKSKMCPKGTILNDSHAEIMCRRAFMKYLYSHMQRDSLIFSYSEDSFKFSLKPNIRFHFFTTHVPCGDAAIFPKKNNEDVGDIIISLDSEQTEEVPAKKQKTECDDIYRTGAKCLREDSKQDLKRDGSDYHVVGVVRTKPGRGDPTASASCSDKIAKWCHLGIQGALLMELLETPIYLSTFTISSKTPFCKKALKRALFERIENIELLPPYKANDLGVYTANLDFPYSKKEQRQPCSSSIAWSPAQKERYFEVAVNGRKQGVTKKHLTSEKGRLKICKLELFKLFLYKTKEFNVQGAKVKDLDKLTYHNAKHSNKLYHANWNILKNKFGVWTHKDPQLLNFIIE